MDRRDGLRLCCALMLALVLAPSLSGCYGHREIEQSGFVLAIGLDVGEEQMMRVVAQVAVPAAIAGTQEGGGGQQTAILLSTEGHTVSEAIVNLSKVSPNRLFWGHADTIVATTRFFEAALHVQTDTFLREREFRPGARVYVTRDDLGEVLTAEFPTLSGNAIYIDDLTRWQQIHSTSPATSASKIAVMLRSRTQAVMIPQLSLDESATTGSQGSDQKLLRLEGSTVVDTEGVVAELTGDETRGVLWLLGEVRQTAMSIPNPTEIGGYLGIRILRNWSEIRVKVNQERIEDSVVSVLIKGEADITEMRFTASDQTVEDIAIIDSAIDDTVLREVRSALETAQSIGADVFGFAELFRRSMPAAKWNDVRHRWSSVFPELEVSIEVDIRIRRRGMAA